MLHKLINHNADLKRLWDEGYEIEISNGFLFVHHIPYVNSAKEIKYGVIVSTLNLAGDETLKPETHTVHFIGDAPCNKDGQIMTAIINSSNTQKLTEELEVNHYLSQKPQEGYPDYYEKITTYVNMISAPAKSIDSSVTEKTDNIIELDDSESVFNYFDTNSSRAKINYISGKLAEQKIAIVGIGGTGSYILDLVAKTPVKEIHIYDGDIFKSNNAFRAPGAPSIEKLRGRLLKTDYFGEVYSNMHRRIISHGYYIESSNIVELSEMDFVFISLDKGDIRKMIVEYLGEKNIPYIDVGMGLENVDDKLTGVVRITTSTDRKKDHVKKRIPFAQAIENEYSNNIQIADLNAFNATLAIIKWKKLLGFYHDFENENHSTYSINVNMLTSDDHDS